HCFHAMALDESRYNFPLHRLEPNPRLTETWFRGVHSDIGGGNGNVALSSISLHWMFQKAQACGLNLDPAQVEKNCLRMQPGAPVSIHKIDSQIRRRHPLPEDLVLSV
ncbi:MAG: DUF2235 domain-containing protein, partial [Acidobacteriota bacterium]